MYFHVESRMKKNMNENETKKKILSFRDKKISLICILHMVVNNMTFICEG